MCNHGIAEGNMRLLAQSELLKTRTGFPKFTGVEVKGFSSDEEDGDVLD